MPDELPTPVQVAAVLSRRVLGQEEAVRETSVALSKFLAGMKAGNILMIGSSGTGKTTLLQAVEEFLASNPVLAVRSTVVRMHANVLAEEAEQGRAGEVVLDRLLDGARQQLGAEAPVEKLLQRVGSGLVFIDEVDKIRAHVGGQPNIAGIRAQEALLTLIENERVPLELPVWAGGGTTTVDSSGLLFVCAGAFEGLYDAVYDRVTIGRDRGALKSVTVVDGDELRHETIFVLREWLRREDLFDYGMSPQFLSRFDAIVLLADLGVEELVRIFLDSPDSSLHRTRTYFESRGVDLTLSSEAVRRIAAEAARQPRVGARALNEVFRRVIRDYEFDPSQALSGDSNKLMIDLPEVEAALSRSQ
jgi:ATP-dependent Clp protease ATP-binding subunit ClpX